MSDGMTYDVTVKGRQPDGKVVVASREGATFKEALALHMLAGGSDVGIHDCEWNECAMCGQTVCLCSSGSTVSRKGKRVVVCNRCGKASLRKMNSLWGGLEE